MRTGMRHGPELGMAVDDLLPEMIGDVRHEVAAERDVQELQAAADAEHGEVTAHERRPRERELEAVSFRRDAVVRLVADALVVRRIDVAAPGQDEGVDRVECFRDLALDGGQHERDAAGQADDVDVLARE
jgi:hypothetical protein